MDVFLPLTAFLAATTLAVVLWWLRRTRTEILEREVRFRSLIDSAADSFFVHDEDGVIVSVNRAACESLGYSREELVGRTLSTIETALSAEAVMEVCRNIRPGESVALEGMHKRKDGTLFPVEVHLGNLETSRRKLFLALARNISGWKNAEAALLKANRAMTMLIECNQALVRAKDEAMLLQEICRIVVDVGGYAMAWVGAASPALPLRVVAHAGEEDGYLHAVTLADDDGLSPAAVAVRTSEVATANSDDTGFGGAWRVAAVANGFHGVVAIPLRHEGVTFGVLEICSSQSGVFGSDEERLLLELGEDVSYGVGGLLEREERLRIADELHVKSAALESAANAVLITDHQGSIIWVNSAFTELTGYRLEEVINQHPRLFGAGPDRARYDDLWETILSGRVWRGEMVNRRKDGTIYHEEQTITPVAGESGAVRYFVAIKQDITERKLAEAAVLENTRIRNEMEIARQIQRSLLPETFPRVPGVEVSARCVTASHVGGDYYDCYHVDGSKFLHLFIADVSGHSVGAALMMAEVRSTLRATRDSLRGPADTLETLNSLLYEDLDRAELFITMFVGRIDLASRQISFANAGHNRPVIYRAGEDRFLELDTDGLVLGVMRGIDFSEVTIPLAIGDLVLLYTDGIVEAVDEGDEPYGLNRLCAAIKAAYDRSPAGITEHLFNDLSRFTGTTAWQDDISLLVVKIG